MKRTDTPTGSQLPSWWTRQHDTTEATARLLATLDDHLLEAAKLVTREVAQ